MATIARALTVLNPWATPLMTRLKPFEFRRWALPERLIGEPIVLHAGLARPADDLINRLLMELREGFTLTFGGADQKSAIAYLEGTRHADWVSGAAIGVVTFDHPVPAREVLDRADLDPDLLAWPVRSSQPFTAPIKVRGQQGLWSWKGEVVW